MIEVEIKCKPTPEEKAALLHGARFISEEHLTDIYYDSPSYELSLKDFWLRTRNNKFILKIPATAAQELFAKQSNTPKHEIEDEEKIREILNLTNQDSLIHALACAGYTPLYTLTKTRNKYTKSGFIIDIDHATFENFTFDLVEIETLVETPEEISQAMQALITFAQKHGITIHAVPGNLIALIEKVNPEHSALLDKAYAKRMRGSY